MGTELALNVCTTLGCVRSGLNSASNAGFASSVVAVASMICREHRSGLQPWQQAGERRIKQRMRRLWWKRDAAIYTSLNGDELHQVCKCTDSSNTSAECSCPV